MSTPRKLGVFLCLLGFIAVCVLALTMSSETAGFNGLPGIQKQLANEALAVVEPVAPNAEITAEGRNITVQLPDIVPAGFDRSALLTQLKEIDGVRNVEMLGDPAAPVPIDDAPAPVPTEAPADEPDPEPTAEPAEEPTEEPEPEPEPTDEPAAQTLEDVVGQLAPGAIEFEPGTAVLTAVDKAVLDDVTILLDGQTGGPIAVQVHTDNVGDPDVNLLLSQDRANAIVDYLTSGGVDSALLTAQGFGASQPIADNATEQGRATNQRVEFVVEGN